MSGKTTGTETRGKQTERGNSVGEGMSVVRKMIALFTTDWHLCLTPPPCRVDERNWLDTQAGYLQQITKIAGDASIPILHAGDIFDKWNPPTELINFVAEVSPKIYAIPGNHDLPNHCLKDVKKSGYWTLVETGTVLPAWNWGIDKEVDGDDTWKNWNCLMLNACVHPFPWGKELTPPKARHDLVHDICLIHKYLYIKDTGYHGAPEDARIANCYKQFAGYDLVLSGDNHIPHNVVKNGIRFLNGGSLYRRRSNEENYKPAVWKIYDDNSVEPVYLDISKDVFQRTEKKEKVTVGSERQEEINEFIQSIGAIKGETVDFDEAIRRTIRKGEISDGAKEMLIRYLEETQK